MRARVALLAALAALVLSVPAPARTLIQCMGDSITAGELPYDEEDRGGYPARLQALLRQAGIADARVENHGLGGESTTDAIARFGSVLRSDTDIFIFLEGTNDVDQILDGKILFEDTIANIDLILGRVKSLGIRALAGTIIPRRLDVRRDFTNTATYELVLRIRELVRARGYEVADFWHHFPNRERSTFALYYYGGRDPIGHPNSAGFQRMAEIAAGVILAGDVQSPVEGRFRSPGESPEVDATTVYDIDLFDFDSGVLLPSATFVINGEEIPTEVSGGSGRPTLRADSDGKRRCKVVLSVRASDRAEPPNQLDLWLFTYGVSGETLIAGDGNGDCRVDGRDLGRLGPQFGKLETELGFDREYDFVRDGVIDGEDLARLAANFGRGSL